MPDSEIEKVGTSAVSMLGNIPDGMWIVLILIAGAIGFAVEAHLLSGQEVWAFWRFSPDADCVELWKNKNSVKQLWKDNEAFV